MAVWGAVVGGAAGVVGLVWPGLCCCAETQNAAAVNNATAAKERTIFMTFLNYSLRYVEGSWTKHLVVRPATMGWLGRLKGAPDAKANDFLFFVKEERKPVNELVWPGVWIIRKD